MLLEDIRIIAKGWEPQIGSPSRSIDEISTKSTVQLVYYPKFKIGPSSFRLACLYKILENENVSFRIRDKIFEGKVIDLQPPKIFSLYDYGFIPMLVKIHREIIENES